MLEDHANFIPRYQTLPEYQPADRDLNFVLDESVPWTSLERIVRAAAGPLLETAGFGGQYRGKQIPDRKKSYLVTLRYRSTERTLTSDEVDACQQRVIEACRQNLGAVLR